MYNLDQYYLYPCGLKIKFHRRLDRYIYRDTESLQTCRDYLGGTGIGKVWYQGPGGVFRKKYDNLLVETDIFFHFRGLILCNV